MTLLDEYSGYSLVRLVNQERKAGDAVLEMITSLEASFRGIVQKIDLINRDNVRSFLSGKGGEYIVKYLMKSFSSRDIVHELTAPYSPESNVLAE